MLIRLNHHKASAEAARAVQIHTLESRVQQLINEVSTVQQKTNNLNEQMAAWEQRYLQLLSEALLF